MGPSLWLRLVIFPERRSVVLSTVLNLTARRSESLLWGGGAGGGGVSRDVWLTLGYCRRVSIFSQEF